MTIIFKQNLFLFQLSFMHTYTHNQTIAIDFLFYTADRASAETMAKPTTIQPVL